MSDDLVKRLQDYLDCRPWAAGRTFDPTHPECLIAQAKDRIEKLKARVLRLEGYLNGALNVIESSVACDTKEARAELEKKDE